MREVRAVARVASATRHASRPFRFLARAVVALIVTIGGVLPFGRTGPGVVPPPGDEVAAVEDDQRETPGLEPDPNTGDIVMEFVADAQEIAAETGRDAHDELLRQANEFPDGAEVDPRAAPPRR